MALVHPGTEHAFHFLAEESVALCFTNSAPLLTVFYLLNSAAVFLLFLSSTDTLMLTALLNLLAACLHSSYGLVKLDFLLGLVPVLPEFLLQELSMRQLQEKYSEKKKL